MGTCTRCTAPASVIVTEAQPTGGARDELCTNHGAGAQRAGATVAPLDAPDWPVISFYTRADALGDGTLVDVTDTAREAGFRWPVAMTRAAWADTVEWDPANRALQDEPGRLWDVVWMAFCAIRSSRAAGHTLLFHLYRVPNRPTCTTARPVTLRLVTGPGDDAEPVVTIMLPEED